MVHSSYDAHGGKTPKPTQQLPRPICFLSSSPRTLTIAHPILDALVMLVFFPPEAQGYRRSYHSPGLHHNTVQSSPPLCTLWQVPCSPSLTSWSSLPNFLSLIYIFLITSFTFEHTSWFTHLFTFGSLLPLKCVKFHKEKVYSLICSHGTVLVTQ